MENGVHMEKKHQETTASPEMTNTNPVVTFFGLGFGRSQKTIQRSKLLSVGSDFLTFDLLVHDAAGKSDRPSQIFYQMVVQKWRFSSHGIESVKNYQLNKCKLIVTVHLLL